jgi:hypothetical protein
VGEEKREGGKREEKEGRKREKTQNAPRMLCADVNGTLDSRIDLPYTKLGHSRREIICGEIRIRLPPILYRPMTIPVKINVALMNADPSSVAKDKV